MAKNLLSCSLLYLIVTLIVMNICFVDALQSGSQHQHSSDDATKAKLDELEEKLKKQAEELEMLKKGKGNMSFGKALNWVSYGYYTYKLICYFEFLDGLPVVSGTKAIICPVAEKSY